MCQSGRDSDPDSVNGEGQGSHEDIRTVTGRGVESGVVSPHLDLFTRPLISVLGTPLTLEVPESEVKVKTTIQVHWNLFIQ